MSLSSAQRGVVSCLYDTVLREISHCTNMIKIDLFVRL